MKIYINRQETETSATTVQELAQSLNLPERGVALAINNAIVQRSQWAQTTLGEDDRITIIKAAFGG
ncbi:MAG: sulfur carrier protein ThiS [Bacteroidales bacterium]|nr:sulfur carrier protein ThiS [Bacteroidales bacterium]